MTLLDTTIVNIAIAPLGHDFAVSLPTIQWVTTAYLLALSISIPLSGWAADRFGAKRVWMVSVGLFTAGSVLCALSLSTTALIASRGIQGAGGGMILPVGQAIVAQAAGPRRMGRMMGLIGAPTLLAPILGPPIGGLIVEFASWRLLFLVNVPIGILALVLASRMFGPITQRTRPREFDTLGFVVLSSGLALLVYGLSRVGTSSAAVTWSVGGPVLVALALVCLFAVHANRRGDAALLDVRLFRNSRPFVAAAVMSLIFSASLLGVMLLLPIYYQVVRGEGPLAAGLLMAPQGVGAVIGMFVSGWLTDLLGAGRVVLVAIFIGLAGTAVLTQVDMNSSFVLLVVALAVRGLGLGAMMTPAISAALATLRRADVPGATTTLNVIQRIAGAMGTALLAVLLARGVPPSARDDLFATVADRSRAVDAELARAFQRPFWVAWVLLGLLIIPALFVPRRPASTSRCSEARVSEKEVEALA